MLRKVKQCTYNSNTGNVIFDDKIVLMNGDNVGVLQLKGEMDNSVKATLKVKPPKGDVNVIDVEGTNVVYKGISREFALPNKGVGKYQVQLILQLGTSINKSELFEYEVLPSL